MTDKDCPLIDCKVFGKDYFCSGCRHKTAYDARTTSYYHRSHITPEQYLERTGEKFPDEGRVWVRQGGQGKHWTVIEYQNIKGLKEKYPEYEIFCVLPPLPPDN